MANNLHKNSPVSTQSYQIILQFFFFLMLRITISLAFPTKFNTDGFQCNNYKQKRILQALKCFLLVLMSSQQDGNYTSSKIYAGPEVRARNNHFNRQTDTHTPKNFLKATFTQKIHEQPQELGSTTFLDEWTHTSTAIPSTDGRQEVSRMERKTSFDSV